ncbi:MAG: hypothetical protein ACYTGC_14215, partial [Planctomycetota bacterium]
MRPLALEQVRSLHAARNRYGSAAARRKQELLDGCADRALTNPRTVLRYHETLLFLVAYPDHERLRARADQELHRIAGVTPALARSRAGAKVLRNTGLPGTVVEALLSIGLTEWLLERFPGDVEIAWQHGTAGVDLDELLAVLSLPAESDGRLHDRFDTQRWVQFASAGAGGGASGLAWIVRRLRQQSADADLIDFVFDATELRIRWRLGQPEASRTLLRFPERRTFLQRTPPKRTFSLRSLARRPLPAPTRLSSSATRALIETARETLAVRDRETDPVTFANPSEVTLFPLERGLDVALFGLRPAH